MHEIIARLERANRAYYDTGESELTDDEFDALRDYARNDLGLDVSTLTPPSRDTEWAVIEHRMFMPSMPMAPKTLEELGAMATKAGSPVGHSSIKYDGMSVELQYSGGELRHAVLRGDGGEGEDILENAKRVCGIPHSIPHAQDLSVFCELVISWNNLFQLNGLRDDDGLPPYKSPRNAVAMVRSRTCNFRLSLIHI